MNFYFLNKPWSIQCHYHCSLSRSLHAGWNFRCRGILPGCRFYRCHLRLWTRVFLCHWKTNWNFHSNKQFWVFFFFLNTHCKQCAGVTIQFSEIMTPPQKETPRLSLTCGIITRLVNNFSVCKIFFFLICTWDVILTIYSWTRFESISLSTTDIDTFFFSYFWNKIKTLKFI